MIINVIMEPTSGSHDVIGKVPEYKRGKMTVIIINAEDNMLVPSSVVLTFQLLGKNFRFKLVSWRSSGSLFVTFVLFYFCMDLYKKNMV